MAEALSEALLPDGNESSPVRAAGASLASSVLLAFTLFVQNVFFTCVHNTLTSAADDSGKAERYKREYWKKKK